MKKEHFPLVPQHPGPRICAGYFAIGREHFLTELINAGREIGGHDLTADQAYALAIGCKCHCGLCGGYAHCKYRAPRHIGDVLANVHKTGHKSGSLVAYASQAYGNHKDDDVVLDLATGAGTCLTGWDLERGASEIGIRLGVEIEEESLRLAKAVHPNLITAPLISEISIPEDGNLIVLSGLVFNIVHHDVATSWAEAISQARDEFTWVDVSYHPSSRQTRPDEYLRTKGYEASTFYSGQIDGFSNFGIYRCEAITWRR
jgi:hypothetical protein